MCEKILFGTMPDGEPVYLCRLDNRRGTRAEILSLGGIIRGIWTVDRNGNTADVVLGQDNLRAYLENPSCSGAVIGRVANRISGGRFTLSGREYRLEQNDRGNCLHSGSGNYAARNFKVEESGEDEVVLSLRDAGKGGFPGEAAVTVRYQLTEDHTLRVAYRADVSGATPVNLTNHCYFNLGGHGRPETGDHTVMIRADYYTAADENCIPTGEILRVEGTPLDLRQARPLGEAIEELSGSRWDYGGFDHNYVIAGRGFRLAAAAWDPGSGRKLEVYTDAPGMQFYTANHLNGVSKNKEGASYPKHCAYCFETQNFPDAVNIGHFPNPIVMEGGSMVTLTEFRFSVAD